VALNVTLFTLNAALKNLELVGVLGALKVWEKSEVVDCGFSIDWIDLVTLIGEELRQSNPIPKLPELTKSKFSFTNNCTSKNSAITCFV
jgi:hypothetical protein